MTVAWLGLWGGILVMGSIYWAYARGLRRGQYEGARAVLSLLGEDEQERYLRRLAGAERGA